MDSPEDDRLFGPRVRGAGASLRAPQKETAARDTVTGVCVAKRDPLSRGRTGDFQMN